MSPLLLVMGVLALMPDGILCSIPRLWDTVEFCSDLSDGNVKLVAFVRAPLPRYQKNLQHLDNIREKLIDDGFHNVSFIGVNHKNWHARLNINKLRNKVNFTIHQTTYKDDVFMKHGMKQGDILILDRWNRITYILKNYMRTSNLKSSFVEAALLSTLLDQPWHMLLNKTAWLSEIRERDSNSNNLHSNNDWIQIRGEVKSQNDSKCSKKTCRCVKQPKTSLKICACFGNQLLSSSLIEESCLCNMRHNRLNMWSCDNHSNVKSFLCSWSSRKRLLDSYCDWNIAEKYLNEMSPLKTVWQAAFEMLERWQQDTSWHDQLEILNELHSKWNSLWPSNLCQNEYNALQSWHQTRKTAWSNENSSIWEESSTWDFEFNELKKWYLNNTSFWNECQLNITWQAAFLKYEMWADNTSWQIQDQQLNELYQSWSSSWSSDSSQDLWNNEYEALKIWHRDRKLFWLNRSSSDWEAKKTWESEYDSLKQWYINKMRSWKQMWVSTSWQNSFKMYESWQKNASWEQEKESLDQLNHNWSWIWSSNTSQEWQIVEWWENTYEMLRAWHQNKEVSWSNDITQKWKLSNNWANEYADLKQWYRAKKFHRK